ncbi:hypothetical protein I6E12_05980 [Prevotella brevis]|uniref:Uncharacterized protein n=1 Tax=Xylanibacter brevis TaxID=83231 RepID=A0ABS9CH68_9BACT|nr:hypothetical protein [Xylanibacter brevis]MCF2563657.1 hypothetical protein [Xylanibacter brevis]
MLAAIEALEVIPRVQIQRVQQNMTIVILEFWLSVSRGQANDITPKRYNITI